MNNQTNFLKLLGGSLFMAKTNAKKISQEGNTFSLKIKKNNKGVTDCIFILNPNNTYSALFYKNFRFNSTLISSVEKVLPNQLREIFMNHTGIFF